MSWNKEANIHCLLRYACPQLWSRLAATNTPDRRHCEQCDRDVHLVRDEEAFFSTWPMGIAWPSWSCLNPHLVRRVLSLALQGRNGDNLDFAASGLVH